jgi:hypothetical protein
MMKKIFHVAACAVLVAVTGCANRPLAAGASREEVVQRYGQPSRVLPLAAGTRLQYSRQPAGQSVVNVDLDTAGRLVSAREVMNQQGFARVETGRWKRQDVEQEFGRPASIDHVVSWRGDIMTYRWLDAMQDMFFYVYLDPAGTVQKTGQGMEIRNWSDVSR